MEQAAALEHRHSQLRLQQELQHVKQLWLEAKRQVLTGPHLIYEHCCSVPGPLCWYAEGHAFSHSLIRAMIAAMHCIDVSVRVPWMAA